MTNKASAMKKNQPHQDPEKAPASEKTGNTTPTDRDQASPVVPDLQSEMEKYRDQALRSAADLENYRKRMIREKEEAVRFANAGLFEKLLPILDNFELGLEAARGDAAAKGIVDGFSMVHRQLGDFLQASGLQIIEAVGQPFDPKLHEALGHESDPAQADGVVLRQPRRGYRLADRLIRPASVIVNKVS
jgi:molecular chaperone GrpE